VVPASDLDSVGDGFSVTLVRRSTRGAANVRVPGRARHFGPRLQLEWFPRPSSLLSRSDHLFSSAGGRGRQRWWAWGARLALNSPSCSGPPGSASSPHIHFAGFTFAAILHRLRDRHAVQRRVDDAAATGRRFAGKGIEVASSGANIALGRGKDGSCWLPISSPPAESRCHHAPPCVVMCRKVQAAGKRGRISEALVSLGAACPFAIGRHGLPWAGAMGKPRLCGFWSSGWSWKSTPDSSRSSELPERGRNRVLGALGRDGGCASPTDQRGDGRAVRGRVVGRSPARRVSGGAWSRPGHTIPLRWLPASDRPQVRRGFGAPDGNRRLPPVGHRRGTAHFVQMARRIR